MQPLYIEYLQPFFITNHLLLSCLRSTSCSLPLYLPPHHLKDMVGTVEGGPQLLRALTSFTNLILEGKILPIVWSYFFRALLIALEKKDGGVRPIAVGCTLRRLVAKCARNRIMQAMAELLGPKQLGYGIPREVEAAVHATCIYLHNLQPQHLILMTYRDLCWQTLPTFPLTLMIEPGLKLFSNCSPSMVWRVRGSECISACTFCLFSLCCWFLRAHLPDPPTTIMGGTLSFSRVALTLWSSGHDNPPPIRSSLFPSTVLGLSPSDIGIQEAPGDCFGCTRTVPPACCLYKGVWGMASGPPCFILGSANGQEGGPGGHGSPFRRLSLCAHTCASTAIHMWITRASMG